MSVDPVEERGPGFAHRFVMTSAVEAGEISLKSLLFRARAACAAERKKQRCQERARESCRFQCCIRMRPCGHRADELFIRLRQTGSRHVRDSPLYSDLQLRRRLYACGVRTVNGVEQCLLDSLPPDRRTRIEFYQSCAYCEMYRQETDVSDCQ